MNLISIPRATTLTMAAFLMLTLFSVPTEGATLNDFEARRSSKRDKYRQKSREAQIESNTQRVDNKTQILFVFENTMPEGTWRGIVKSPSGQRYVTDSLSDTNTNYNLTVPAESGTYTITFLVVVPDPAATTIGKYTVSNPNNTKISPKTFMPSEQVYDCGDEAVFHFDSFVK